MFAEDYILMNGIVILGQAEGQEDDFPLLTSLKLTPKFNIKISYRLKNLVFQDLFLLVNGLKQFPAVQSSHYVHYL